MSIKLRPYKRRGRKGDGWEVDLIVQRPDGKRLRERLQLAIPSKSAARRWAEQRAAHLLQFGKLRPAPVQEVPTLNEFQDRFLRDYCGAERQKPSGIASKRTILEKHLIPALGKKRLNEISDEDVQRLKTTLATLKPKTVNNVLTVLGKLLRVAEEWRVIDRVPCRVRLLKHQASEMGFYDFSDYARLVEAAEKVDRQVLALVLLGGDAGLRSGEITALERSDIDFKRGFLTVSKSEWKEKVNAPKSGRTRKVPMTEKLASTLRGLGHLKGSRVLYAERGGHATQKVLRTWMAAAQKRAGLKANGGVHILRHTFCSHLAMRGAAANAIRELAGHANLSTTQRYMHLSPAAREEAISLLNHRPNGGQVEAEIAIQQNVSNIN